MKHIQIVINNAGHFETVLGEDGQPLSIKEITDLDITWITDKNTWKKYLTIPIEGEG